MAIPASTFSLVASSGRGYLVTIIATTVATSVAIADELVVGGRLPDDRLELCDRVVDNVLYHRYGRSKRDIDVARARLAVIAHGMHTGWGLGEARALARKSGSASIASTEITPTRVTRG